MPERCDRDDSATDVGRGQRTAVTASKAGGMLVVLLLAAYGLLAPDLNSRLGWELPLPGSELPDDQVLEGAPTATGAGIVLTSAQDDQQGTTTEKAGADPKPTTAGSGPSRSSNGPLADRVGTSRKRTAAAARGPPSASKSDPSLRYGLLREISRDRFISPAGLLYTPGSAEGHRLEHLRRHTKDDPNRPGSHGVFDGDMEGALKTIDRAYQRAKKGQRTTKKVDRDRTIYTVDLGSRIGYVGGRDGARRRKPMARRVRIVLEGNRVITAYPL